MRNLPSAPPRKKFVFRAKYMKEYEVEFVVRANDFESAFEIAEEVDTYEKMEEMQKRGNKFVSLNESLFVKPVDKKEK